MDDVLVSWSDDDAHEVNAIALATRDGEGTWEFSPAEGESNEPITQWPMSKNSK